MAPFFRFYWLRKLLLKWLWERWRMISFLSPYLGYRAGDGWVEETLRGCVFRYDPRSYIGECLFTGVEFEDREIDAIATRLAQTKSPLILDVGANTGWHTVRWARQLPDARVHAFEPSGSAADFLEANLKLNALQARVRIERQAVADSAGTRELIECQDSAYSSMLETGRSPVLARHRVAVTTLDAYVRQHQLVAIALIKIDVEGLEWEVVRGAAQTLRAQKPDLFIEIDERNRASPSGAELIQHLLDAGYRAFVFRDGVLHPTTPGEYKFWYYNYFFTAAPEFRC